MSDFVKAVTIDVKAGTVQRVGGVRPSAGADEVQMDVTYSFGDVSEEKLIELASRTVHIAYQSAWRASHGTPDALAATATVNVAEWLERERRGGGGFKRTPDALAKSAAKMTREQQLELVAKMQALIDAGA